MIAERLFLPITIGSLTIIFFQFWKWCKSHYNIRSNMKRDWKTSPTHWFYGHLQPKPSGKKQDILKWIFEREKMFPIGYTMYTGPLRASIYLHHPEMIKQVLLASASSSIKSAAVYNVLERWIVNVIFYNFSSKGKGLLILNPPQWTKHRKLLTNAFHFEILKPYVKIINQSSNILVKKWKYRCKNEQVLKVEMFRDSSLFTLDTILKCLMSYESNCQLEESDNQYIKAVYDLSKFIIQRRISRNIFQIFDLFYFRSETGKRFLDACDTVHKMSDRFIRERKLEFRSSRKERNCYLDFLDILLKAQDENGIGLSDEAIRAEIDTFLFEGHDTTASAITWSLYCLAKYPQHQADCLEEIRKVVGDKEDVGWSQLSMFPYLTRCIKETLRLFPSVPIINRQLLKDVAAMGRTIKKGTLVSLSLMGAQRNPDIWENPLQFNPDRFKPDKTSRRNHHAFIPFSAGPRNCIGQNFAMNEIKIALIKIIKEFEIDLNPDHDVKPVLELVLRAESGVHFLMKRRNL